jgi:hypothetical protein
LSFGLKPIVELGIEEALKRLGADSVDIGSSNLAELISQVSGGIFVGAVHSCVSASVGAYALSKSDAPVFSDAKAPDGSFKQSVLRREVNDAATVSLPVFGAFTASFAAGNALRSLATPPLASNSVVKAAFKTAQSVTGGFVQSGVTLALKNAMTESYDKTTKTVRGNEVVQKFAKAARNQFFCEKSEDPAVNKTKEVLKNGWTKIFAGAIGTVVAGMVAKSAIDAVYSGDADAVDQDTSTQAISGAVGMVTFLATWFVPMHLGGLAGGYFGETDAASVQPQDEDLDALESGQAAASPLPASTIEQSNPLFDRG